MRIEVEKFLFVGLKSDRDRFFNKAQELGIIEFIDQKRSPVLEEPPPEIQNLQAAIKILRRLPAVEQEEIEDLSLADSTARCIIKLNYALEAFYEEQRVLNQEMSSISIFGDFDPKDLQYIAQEGKRQIQYFFCREHAKVDDLPELIYAGAAYGLKYFIAINQEKVAYPGLTEILINKPISQLKSRLSQVKRKIAACESELRLLADRNDLLHRAVLDKLNKKNLLGAQSLVDFLAEDKIFSIEGWVALSDLEQMQELVDASRIHVEKIAIEKDDHVPTHLCNKGFQRIGEDLVKVYDIPSTQDGDPSVWVLAGFILFFSMIISDGGYGLIFFLISMFFWIKYPKLEGVKARVLKLFTVLGLSCLLWGVLSHSFFGLKFHPDSFVRKYSLIDYLVEQKTAYHIDQRDETYFQWIERYKYLQGVKEPRDFLRGGVRMINGKPVYEIMEKFSGNVMIEIALLIGIVHLSLSFLRGIRRNWSAPGWILAMLGGYLYFPSLLAATTMPLFLFEYQPQAMQESGLELLYAGIFLAVFFGVLQHRLMGLLELSNMIQVFADVLSYLRIYALGLAGAMMSSTFNDIASSMSLMIGVLVLFIGHLVNIALSLIGGVIHGLRLHFIEWYHYSFEGGGKLHQPLKLFKTK